VEGHHGVTAEPLAFIGTSDLAGLVRGKSVPLSERPGRMGREVGITPSNLHLSVSVVHVWKAPWVQGVCCMI